MEKTCSHCGKNRKTTGESFEYAALAGLDPSVYRITLHGIKVFRCKCGLTPQIPNLEGLHTSLVLGLVSDNAPLDASAYRFIRKTLGMTQEKFAARMDVTPVTVSKWENGGPWPDLKGETAIRVFIISMLLEDKNLSPHLFTEDAVQDLIRLLYARIGAATHRRAAISVESIPPAWMIRKIMDCGSGAVGAR